MSDPVTLSCLSTAEAVAAIPNADRIGSREQLAGWRMFRALANVPCTCEHNVLYAGMQADQVVTKQCGRGAAMAAWLELQPQERIVITGAPPP